MTDQEESDRGEKLRSVISGPRTKTGPIGEDWDAKMAAKGAWSDPALSPHDLAIQKQAALASEREMARNQASLLETQLQYLRDHIKNLSTMIYLLDDILDNVLEKDKPEEPTP